MCDVSHMHLTDRHDIMAKRPKTLFSAVQTDTVF